MCGFIAQLVEHRTGIAEVTGSNPVEALIFFSGFFIPIALEIHCDDHLSPVFSLVTNTSIVCCVSLSCCLLSYTAICVFVGVR